MEKDRMKKELKINEYDDDDLFTQIHNKFMLLLFDQITMHGGTVIDFKDILLT